MYAWISRCILGTLLLTAILLTSSGTPRAETEISSQGFGEFLPEPLNEDWSRSAPETMPADVAVFGGGISTRATYTNEDETCVITITGDAPMMRGVSMTFSNPAAASISGSQIKRVGDEQVVVYQGGEVQALATNILIQYTGTCTQDSKFAYVAITDMDGLRISSTSTGKVSGSAEAGDKPLQPQAGALEWERTFGGADNDWAYAMTGTSDGGLGVAGRTLSKGAGREDVWIVRIDGEGALLWDRTFGGAAIDRARAIVETADGGFAVAGATESKGAGEYDVWVLKLDQTGALIWDRTFGGIATDWASAIVETRDGGLAIGAYTQATPEQEFDFWVIKLDSTGELQWDRTFGAAAIDWASAITELADGGIGVVGHTESKGAGGADMWVLKLDADGALLWDRTFGGSERDYAATVGATQDGGLVVAGPTESYGAGLVDIRVLKLDAQGDVMWDHIFGGADSDWARAVVETRDGGHAVAGYTMSKGEGLFDFWILKLDAQGELQWDLTFGGKGNEWARALVEMPDGGLAMAGDTWSNGEDQSDIWVVKIAPDAPALDRDRSN